MKLRVQGNSLRLRLTRSEVAALDSKGEVTEEIRFSSGGALTYRLEKRTGAEALAASLSNGLISISVPAAAAARWVGSEEVGVYGQDGELRIAIEKDFRCLTRASDEQEADAYPHPAEPCTL